MVRKFISGMVFVTIMLTCFSGIAFSDAVLPDPSTYNYPVDGQAGWPELKVALKRIDLWIAMPDGQQPREDLFVVLLGEITATGASKACLYQRNYELQIGDNVFKTPGSTAAWSIRDVYKGIDDPVSFFGTCVRKGETKTIFLWFDVKRVSGSVTLKLDGGGQIAIDSSFEAVLKKTGLSKSMPSTPTEVPLSTATSIPTPTPIIAARQAGELISTVTSTPISSYIATGVVAKNANLRTGPGTNFAVAGNIKAGQEVKIVAQDAQGNWYNLSNGKWIAASLVNVNITQTTTIPVASVPQVTPTLASTPQSGNKIALEFEVKITQNKQAILVGKTDFPAGTAIMTSVEGGPKSFFGQDSVEAKDGLFTAGPFGPTTGFPNGVYVASATIVGSKISVEKEFRIGNAAEVQASEQEKQALVSEARDIIAGVATLIAEGRSMQPLRESSNNQVVGQCMERMRTSTTEAKLLQSRAENLPQTQYLLLQVATGEVQSCVTCGSDAEYMCGVAEDDLKKMKSQIENRIAAANFSPEVINTFTKLLVQSGDLNSIWTGGDVYPEAPVDYYGPAPHIVLNQDLVKGDSVFASGQVVLWVFNNTSDALNVYRERSDLVRNVVDKDVEFQNPQIGEQSLLVPGKGTVFIINQLVFIRCNAVVEIMVGDKTQLDLIRNYAASLDQRLQPKVCD